VSANEAITAILMLLLYPVTLGAAVLGLALLVLAAWIYFRPKKKPFEPEVISDWRPTNHIDFVGPDDVMLSADEDVPAQFYLCVQEQRLVANISGMPTPEVRWRYATKAEAKDVVRIAERRVWDAQNRLLDAEVQQQA
jgi:hypothetical protein